MKSGAHAGGATERIALTILFCSLLSASFGAPSVGSFADSVNRALAGQSAAAVVVRVRDRRVLAAYNLPVLRRRVASPGSAIKPFVLQLMLESGAVRPQDSISCRRGLVVAGRKLDCSHSPEFTTVTAEEALALSCNSYFVAAAERLKPGELERRFRELGFTEPSGLLPGEGQGRIVPANSLEARQLLAIGVAGIEVTPLELAFAYLQLARLDPSTASPAQKVVLAGLRAATDYGLAQNAKPGELSVAGKTGTAGDPSDPHTHAWFAGYMPAGYMPAGFMPAGSGTSGSATEKPEIVVVVFAEHGHGSIEAANLARRIFEAYEKNRP